MAIYTSTLTFIFQMITISVKEIAEREGGSLEDFLVFTKVSSFGENMTNKNFVQKAFWNKVNTSIWEI